MLWTGIRRTCGPVVVWVLLAVSRTVHAEGVLVKSVPDENAELIAFDGRISLTFSGNVSDRSPTLIVVDGGGNRVDRGDMALVIDEHSELTATTKPLPPGAYAIRYRVLTEDGLVVSGIRHFSVKS